MTEIGGSATDVSVPNLEMLENSPSTSNEQQKGSSLKRPAETDDKSRSPVKKKKTAEEEASSVRGRNQAIKKLLKKEKEKQRKQHKPVCDIEELKEHRERLMAKIDELEQREMLWNMKAEEKKIKREERLKKALADINKILEKAGYNSEPIEENEVPDALLVHIPDWPCLDQYVQDFAFDRLNFLRERGVSMSMEDLTDIINKVKSRDRSVKFPTEKESLERLLCAVNKRIGEAVHERRYDNLMKNIVEYPRVDAKEVETMETLEGPLAILKVVKKEGEAERQELREQVGKIILAVDEANKGAVNILDVIELDDEDDDEKECDEDELYEEDEDEEDEDDESDEELFGTLNKYRAAEKKGLDIMEEESEDHEVSDQPELPEMMEEEEGIEEEKQPELIEEPTAEIPEEENADPVPMEEYDVVEEENEEIEQVEQTDSIAEKTIEETPESMEVKEIMEGHEGSPTKSKDERPDSREGKEVMEGGTSTNSPTVERDERMKELDKTSDVKETGPKNDASSDDEVEVLDEINYDTRPGPWNPQEFKTNDAGATIVLDDDDEESLAERRRLRKAIEAVPKSELPIPPKMPTVKKEEYMGPPDHPPVAPRITMLEAWRRKVDEIQLWVDSSPTEMDDIDHDIQKVVAPVATSYDDDAEIMCIIDDFEMDSVSHSGLKLRKQLKEEEDKEDEAGPSVTPSPPTHTPKETDTPMVNEETVQKEVVTAGNDSIIMLD